MSKSVAIAVRSALKSAGFAPRMTSVRTSYGGFSSSVDITVKPGVDIEAVRMIANKFKEVSRCEVTGEVLLGGNTYVFVNQGR